MKCDCCSLEMENFTVVKEELKICIPCREKLRTPTGRIDLVALGLAMSVTPHG
jgi:hypothetical protein